MASQTDDLVRSTDIRRDNDYYSSSGDSIIRVENTLFKIHKFILVHNSSVFATMFDLPVGKGNTEGSSDDLPIILQGENAKDFRVVLKHIYAPPTQIQVHSMTMAALPDVISVAKFAEKYALDHWKDWAAQFLLSRTSNLGAVSLDNLPDLYSLSNLLEDTPTRNQIVKRWCEVVETDDLPILPVLTAADLERRAQTMSDLESLPREHGVSPAHFQRMLSAFMLLTFSWNRFRMQLPVLFREAPCGGGGSQAQHEANCIPYFLRKWVEATVAAEYQYPQITRLASRLAHASHHMQKKDSGISPRSFWATECFADITGRFIYEGQNEMALLLEHFFPKAAE
ncbi:hypothetical protein DFH08DRAFT_1086285 [Mycena albidolilacea]|uniref:BTB domain-containing protein n=1 Tax=Mycena albidolilacea TaxID=1033008 RepID=A0AAD6ZEQ9_9AGAR|nr:hypothetical protein DFH08DRAFT_1086285 [Mycena albidolilacea]